MKYERGQIGLIGEYATLSALILNGFCAARTDGNSKDIDILCTNPDFNKAIKIQVKAQKPSTVYLQCNRTQPYYAFLVADLKKYHEKHYREAILNQQIYFVFYLCPQTPESVDTGRIDPGRKHGRFFVASPEEVVNQLDRQINYFKKNHKKTSRLYFQLFATFDEKHTREWGDLFTEYENRWDKLVENQDEIRLDGPMSYDHYSPITPEQLAEAKRHNREFAKKVREKLEKEFGSEFSKR